MDAEKPYHDFAKKLVEQYGCYDPRLELSSYIFPPLDLLDINQDTIPITVEELEHNKHVIVETLNYAKIKVDRIKATIGSRIILYEITPSPGVRVSQVIKMKDDIALQLGQFVKVIGAIIDRGTIGIEVPHEIPFAITLRSVISTNTFNNNTMDLPIVIGKNKHNEVFMLDLTMLPHLLIAGSTGQGKSVSINTIISSLLYQKHPAELKFVLIDFNKLELTPFRNIERHFLAKLPDEADAIVTDIRAAINTLTSLSIELNNRYDLFKDAQVRNIKEYNKKYINREISNPEKHRYLPFLVVVIDEFADLISLDNTVETLITRLAQLGRPAGVHLIISTQRPSVKVITGNIKANFISRLAFRVATSIDSRTIIDRGGAEELQGDGDMLYYTGSNLVNLQGVFTATEEVEKISSFIGNQKGYPTAMLLPDYYNGDDYGINDFDPDSLDPMFEEAARLVVIHQQGSTSLIQRKLKLGYNRAGRIIDQMEAAGIIGPFEGSKAREVLYPDEYSLLMYLESLNLENPFAEIKSSNSEINEPTVIKESNLAPPTQPKKKSFFERLFNR